MIAEKGDDMDKARLTVSAAAATLAVILLAAVALSAVACGSGGASGGGSSSPGGSETVSPVVVEAMGPEDFSVAGYAGKPLVVNFFGSWCGPCNEEAPALAEFAKGNAQAGFVGVALDDSKEDATGFMAEYGLDFPVVIDDGSLAAEYGITGVPTTIFFDSGGAEKDRIIGAASVDMFSASLAKAE